MHLLFEHFLTDLNEYLACERYWQSLIQRVSAESQQANEWVPWISRNRPDGTPVERDGNPIYDAYSKRLNRAIRILQHERSAQGVEIAAWIKTYGAEFAELPGSELFINLCLSQESAVAAEKLMSAWMRPDVSNLEMKEVIERLLEPYTET